MNAYYNERNIRFDPCHTEWINLNMFIHIFGFSYYYTTLIWRRYLKSLTMEDKCNLNGCCSWYVVRLSVGMILTWFTRNIPFSPSEAPGELATNIHMVVIFHITSFSSIYLLHILRIPLDKMLFIIWNISPCLAFIRGNCWTLVYSRN